MFIMYLFISNDPGGKLNLPLKANLKLHCRTANPKCPALNSGLSINIMLTGWLKVFRKANNNKRCITESVNEITI